MKDVIAGMIIMAVSIPISMGYAQIAGLPAVYGLYGSVFPILFFALFSTSRQFIFGVDAAPAAIVGAALVSLGIESGSEAAMQYVPVIAFLTGIWLLLFYFFKSRKNRGLHFDTGDGRIYQRDCTDDYSDADTEDPWRKGRIWRTSGTAQAYRRDVQRNQLAVSGTWCGSVAAASHGRKSKFPNSRQQL